jgi:DNA-binding response OmpR family regulator
LKAGNESMAKILVVEDNKDIADLVSQALGFENHAVEAVVDGQEGLERLQVYDYDMAILDWDLPGKSGVSVCKEYRTGGGAIPILMLTGKGKVSEKEEGLDAGADDYLTKPFNMRELTARVRSLLRRSGGRATANVLSVGDVSLDPQKYQVTRAGAAIKLVPKEFALLEFLMRNPNRVYSAEALFSHVWKADDEASPDIVRTHIKNLRKKLGGGAADSIIETVHGVGYRVSST